MRNKDKCKCKMQTYAERHEGHRGSSYRKHDGGGSGIYEITRAATRCRGAPARLLGELPGQLLGDRRLREEKLWDVMGGAIRHSI